MLEGITVNWFASSTQIELLVGMFSNMDMVLVSRT